jgi:hypothetical protein
VSATMTTRLAFAPTVFAAAAINTPAAELRS